VNIAVYVAATTSVEFVLIILLRRRVHASYITVTRFIRDHALHWLYNKKSARAGQFEYDHSLQRMPKFSLADISWGYAKDGETLRCRLQIMMYAMETLYRKGKAANAS
jgi:hypothetical protein